MPAPFTWLPIDLLLIDLVVTIGAILWVLLHPREPRAMLAWILGFLLVPLISVLLFLLIGEPRLQRIRRRRRRRRSRLALPDNDPHTAPPGLDSPRLTPSMRKVAHLVHVVTRQLPLEGNRVQIQQSGAVATQELEAMLKGATDHIHMEFYLFRTDYTGRRIAAILRERAAAGVEVRLLLDFIGSWSFVWCFSRILRNSHVEVGWFMPIIPWRGRWRMNFRNHRKIVVVDGKVAATGSLNIGDEYAGIDQRLGPWHDTLLTLQGPIVEELQETFLEDWHYATGRVPNNPIRSPCESDGPNHLVQLIPSGPDQSEQVVQLTVHGMLAEAEREICISTPYFIPDAPLLVSLRSAAYRGVRVRLLLPARSDHRLSLWAGRSYYREICAAGAEIYEYPFGMLHSKLLMVDGEWAMAGSANMDERSFRLNFEATLLLYDQALVQQLLQNFQERVEQSQKFLRPETVRWGLGESILLGVARIAGPLL